MTLVPWEVRHIRNEHDLDQLKQLTQETERCAIDTETTGIHWALGHRPFMATFAADENIAWATYDPVLTGDYLRFMEQESHTQIYHNAKFDLQMLRLWTGWEPVDGFMYVPLEDTMQGFRLQHPLSSAALKTASALYVDSSIDIDGPLRLVKTWLKDNTARERINGKWILSPPTYKDVPPELMLPYATQDAWLTIKSFFGLQADLDQRDPAMRTLYEREVQLVALLVHSEIYGWPVNSARLMSYLRTAHEEFTAHYARLNERFGKYFMDTKTPGHINISSPPQLRHLIYDILGEPVKHKTDSEKNAATDEAALADMNDREAADLILLTRKWKKAKDKYSEIGRYLIADGAVHTELKPDKTKTGRMSSTAPALQNVSVYKPTKIYTWIRDVFCPKPGSEWLLADYSQVEMRLLAHYSQEPSMLEAIRTEKDLHSLTASRMYGLDIPPGDFCNAEQKRMRNFGKLMNFTIVYGGGRRRVADALMYGSAQNEALEADEARRALRHFNPFVSERLLASPFAPLANELLSVYRNEYPIIRDFTQQVQDVVKWRSKHEGMGYIKNAFGRINPVTAEQAHKAVNYIIQGTAADLMKSAMINAWHATEEYCKLHGLRPWVDVHLFMSIHDELLWAIPVGHARGLAAHIQKSLEYWPQFTVPIRVDYAFVAEDASWAKKKGLVLAA